MEAVWELLDIYGPFVMRVIRRNLGTELRGKFDSEDFLQAVWLSFFTDDNHVQQADSPERLVALLTAMARNKLVDESRRFLGGQKRQIHRERSINAPGVNQHTLKADAQATPSQFAIARERWQEITKGLTDEQQQIIRMLVGGATHAEAAGKVGTSTKTVQRLLHRIMQDISK